MNQKQKKRCALLFLLLCCLFPKASYAYFDPTTMSYLLKILIAGLIMASLAIKTFWVNLAHLVTGLFSKKEKGRDERKVGGERNSGA